MMAMDRPRSSSCNAACTPTTPAPMTAASTFMAWKCARHRLLWYADSHARHDGAPAGVKQYSRRRAACSADRFASGTQPVAGAEDPRHHGQADGEKDQNHAQTQRYADIGHAVETPAETA